MQTNDYLCNPVVTKGFYNVKCTAIETTGDPYQPTILIRLQVVPYEPYGRASNAVFHATLRPAPNAKPLREKFRNTFGIDDDPAEAVGRFCCVLLDVAEFKGRRYGAVHFIQQSEIARRQAGMLERHDRNGEIPWAEDGVPLHEGQQFANRRG